MKHVYMLLPAMIISMGTSAKIPENALNDPLYDLGYLDVTHYPGVDPSGKEDSYEGIQQALKDSFDKGLVVYFPAGTYRVSDTLKAYKWKYDHLRSHKLVGSAKGESRPLIKLTPNAKGFQDPDTPRPVLVWRQWWALAGSSEPETEPENPLTGNPPGFRDTESVLFDAKLRNIDFDLSGNPGAVGVGMSAAQYSTIVNVRIDATGAYAGFYGIPGRNSGAIHIEVQGGRYGIVRHAGAGSVIVGARFFHQTESALLWRDFVPLTMVGFHIITDSALVIQNVSEGQSLAGSMSLIDGVIETDHEGPAIDNSAGKNLYLRNRGIYFAGLGTTSCV